LVIGEFIDDSREIAMARNRVQFQKGLSEADFVARYGSEDQCRAAVMQWRWPDGFRCPKCSGRAHCIVGPRKLFQCNACRRQTSLTAGTIFDQTKAPLTTWFRAMYHLTQSKQGMSSIELGRRLGTTQTTAWKIKTKLAEVMRRDGETVRLVGRIEMDDVFLGGHRPGGKPGRGSPGKTPFVAAVETTDDGKPKRIRLKRKRIVSLAKRVVMPGSTVVTDGLSGFRGLVDAGCQHIVRVTGKGYRAAKIPEFKNINTILGNIKSALVGTYRAVRRKHAGRFLAEFEWRFNHRGNLAAMIPNLVCAAVRTQPAPYRWLKMADGRA
jgi:transposase-like protein/ribosomal protein L37AE/L43A